MVKKQNAAGVRSYVKKMRQKDEILHTTPSGRGSTIKIRYYLSSEIEDNDFKEIY